MERNGGKSEIRNFRPQELRFCEVEVGFENRKLDDGRYIMAGIALGFSVEVDYGGRRVLKWQQATLEARELPAGLYQE